MRQYVGHRMKFVVQGFGAPFTGLLVNEDTQFAYVKSETRDEVWHLPRPMICGFTCLDGEPDEYIPLMVLACDCKSTGCVGVQYVKSGAGFSQKDLEVFTAQCPCKTIDCRVGSKGELRGVSSKLLKQMFTGMLFGEYPEKRKEVKRGRPTKTESSKESGGGQIEGEVSTVGGTGQPAETTV